MNEELGLSPEEEAMVIESVVSEKKKRGPKKKFFGGKFVMVKLSDEQINKLNLISNKHSIAIRTIIDNFQIQ